MARRFWILTVLAVFAAVGTSVPVGFPVSAQGPSTVSLTINAFTSDGVSMKDASISFQRIVYLTIGSDTHFINAGDLPKTISGLPPGATVNYEFNSGATSSVFTLLFRWLSTSGLGSAAGQASRTGSFTLSSDSSLTGTYHPQYLQTFNSSGLPFNVATFPQVILVTGSVAGGVSLLGGTSFTGIAPFGGGPYVDKGATVNYRFEAFVTLAVRTFTSGGMITTDQTFILQAVTGATSPYQVTGPNTITGNYVAFLATGDTTRPDTSSIAQPPALTNSGDASFSFSGSDDTTSAAELTFECSLDGGPFLDCISPKLYSGLLDRNHTFQVRAVDKAANRDSSPASFSWTVDRTAPISSFLGTPPSATNATSALFGFSAADPVVSGVASGVARLECSLDSAAFGACTTPQTLLVTEGSHTFSVRAVDQAGNVGASATFSWLFDFTPPRISLNPDSGTYGVPVRFTWLIADPLSGSVSSGLASCSFLVNGSQLGFVSEDPCPSGSRSLGAGTHLVIVSASDKAGNAASVTRTYTVDLTPPVINATLTPPPNINGWNNSSVTVNWTISDPESGILSSSGCSSTTLTNETPRTVLTCLATNGGGLANSASVTVRIDKTPPAIRVSPLYSFFYPGPIKVRLFAFVWEATDPAASGSASGLGLSSCGVSLDGNLTSSSCSGNQFLDVLTTHTALVSASDLAGNTSSVSRTYTFADMTSNGADSDGDGLLDDWEVNGIYNDPDGDGPIPPQFIDLPALGADPRKPDIFLHIDWMQDGIHIHALSNAAIQTVVNAFANSAYKSPTGSVGINLHVDQGSSSILDFTTGQTWGFLSRANPLTHVVELGTKDTSGNYNLGEFDNLKNRPGGFTQSGRAPVFHYVVAAHKYGGTGSSGIARGIGSSDLIVSLGTFPSEGVGNVSVQAGTLMHELGHNLGLRHGGGDDDNYKPNYLSVMNYSFQLGGLIKDVASGTFDYSLAALGELNENSLNEPIGLGPASAGFGTIWFCGSNRQTVSNANSPIDWNCSPGLVFSPPMTIVSADVNQDMLRSVLKGYSDWVNLKFKAGAIGAAGISPDLPLTTAAQELSFEEAQERQLFPLPNNQLPPNIVGTQTPGPNANGWNNTDVTVSFACSSPYGIASCPGPTTLTTDGKEQKVTGTATDVNGNTSFFDVFVSIDKTAPPVTATLSPAPGPDGWIDSDGGPVTVAWSGTDNLSGIASCDPPTVRITGGIHTVTGSCTDKAGNKGTHTQEVKIVVKVPIDIKPGSDPNSINLKSPGNIPVGVRTGATHGVAFDATTIVRSTVKFAGAPTLPFGKSPEDFDGDGVLDMVYHFKTQETNLTASSTQGCLTGETTAGVRFKGCDNVRIVP